jgi:hypothetical protein
MELILKIAIAGVLAWLLVRYPKLRRLTLVAIAAIAGAMLFTATLIAAAVPLILGGLVVLAVLVGSTSNSTVAALDMLDD